MASANSPAIRSSWQAGNPFTFACNARRSFRTVTGACRLAPVSQIPVPFQTFLPNSGPFSPPAFPDFAGTRSLSATLPAQAGPRRLPVDVCAPPTGLPVSHPLPFAHRPSSLPRRRQPVGRSFATLFGGVSGRWQRSPRFGRVGLRIRLFEACSVFPRVTAWAFTERSAAALFPRNASVHIVTAVNRSEYFRPLCATQHNGSRT